MKGNVVLSIVIAAGIFCLLSGCRMVALPGREPFGERTYSDERAQVVYQNVCAEMERIDFFDWNGYSMELDEGWDRHDFYRTEEYTAAWHEGAEEYLWYQERLYCADGETITYRDMTWEELQSDEYAARQWELVREVLTQNPENLEYKYIPMSSERQYLLTAKYPTTEWEGQTKYALRLSFSLDEDGTFAGCTLHWQENGDRVLDLAFFPYESSYSLQAERKIWSFAHDGGLLEEVVPALSTQEDDREWCRSIIASIDFNSILDRAEYRENLTFPVPFTDGDVSKEGTPAEDT